MACDTVVIVNPVSAQGRTAVLWPEIQKGLSSAGIEFDWSYTTGPGAATRMARDAVLHGYRTVVAVGGDGTFNEIINGIVDPEGLPAGGLPAGGPPAGGVSVGMVSCGTGRDFIRTLRLSRDWHDAPAIIVAGRRRAVDVGRVAYSGDKGESVTRLFANVADVGLGGETALRSNRVSKAWGGFISYLVGAITTILIYENKHVSLYADGKPVYSDPASAVIVANGRFFGGGMLIAPDAVLDDGMLDVVILGNMTKVDLLTNVPRVYSGSHLRHPKVRHFRASTLEMVTEHRMILETDGECQEVGSVKFSILPNALSVIA